MIDCWKKVLAQYKEYLSSDMYGTWFSQISCVENPEENQEGKVTLAVPTNLHREFLTKHWKTKIETALKEASGKDTEVTFIIAQASKPKLSKETSAPPYVRNSTPTSTSTPVAKASVNRQASLEEKALKCGLHQGLTFDSFVTGSANEKARSVAEQVCKNPGKDFNPFFIYGGVGVGKTHLMHATGRALLAANPDIKLLCISTDTFIKDVVSMSSYGQMTDEKIQKFEEKYHSVDALLIDDVQGLSHKGGSQSRLFAILEALLPAKKQMIFTCDTYAGKLSDFDERIVSRMSGGLPTEIKPAGLELRAAIVLEKAKRQGVSLDMEVAMQIATTINTNIRELEGALNTVLVEARVNHSPVTVELAKEALKQISSPGEISIEAVQKVTAEYYNISLTDMFSKSRKAGIVMPRSVAMYLAKELTQKSLIDIGSSFGGRDHTTVLHAVKKIGKERATNEELNTTIHLIEQALKNWR